MACIDLGCESGSNVAGPYNLTFADRSHTMQQTQSLRTRLLLLQIVLFATNVAVGQQPIDLALESFETYNVTLTRELFKGKDSIAVDQTEQRDSDEQYSFARLKNLNLHNGVIDVTVAGQPRKDAAAGARGFVGIAFRVPNDPKQFEVFYLRPTNGRADDQVRRNHSLQYVSHPGYSWQKLRSEFPEKYESYADLVPGEWTKVKIEVKDDRARLYVNGAEQPSLIVNDLKQGKELQGSVGFWIAVGTEAHFTDLKVTKKD